MKKAYLLLISFLLLSFTACDKDDTPPIEQLPEATQEGLGTFGCLVDGKPFVETGTFFNTFYQQTQDGFFFNLSAEFDDRNPFGIGFGTEGKPIEEGGTYTLIERELGNAWGFVFFKISPTDFEPSTTTIENSGSITITKMDFDNGIVSGTFSFQVEDPFTNEIVRITEGRFDTLFTQ